MQFDRADLPHFDEPEEWPAAMRAGRFAALGALAMLAALAAVELWAALTQGKD